MLWGLYSKQWTLGHLQLMGQGFEQASFLWPMYELEGCWTKQLPEVISMLL